MDLIPVDPNSQTAKDILAVHQQSQSLPPVSEGGGVQQLVPIDPNSSTAKQVLALHQTQQASGKMETTVPQRGKDLTPTPIKPHPRPMGAVSDFNIDTRTTVPPTKESASGSYAPAAMLMGGGLGRIMQAVIGGGSSALEGGSPMEIALNAALPRVAEGVGQVGKAALRTASKFMSPSAMRTAGNTMQDAARAVTTPVVAPTATRDALQTVGSSIRTPDAAKAALQEHVDKLTARYAAGQPFDYGDFFEHMNQIGQKASAFFDSTTNQRSGKVLKTVQDAMAKDLAAIGPEAKIATDAWRNAVGGIGGWGAAKKIWTALGATSIPGVGALVAPVAGVAGGAGAVVSALAGLAVRAPGVGQSLAKSLITPDGAVVKQALPALAQLIKENVKQNGND